MSLTLLRDGDDGIPWACIECDGAYMTAPGSEPPSPLICETCVSLTIAEVAEALSGVVLP